MATTTTVTTNAPTTKTQEAPGMGSVLIGTGLTLASLIIIPAISQSLGMGPSLTSAVRVALMKASNKV